MIEGRGNGGIQPVAKKRYESADDIFLRVGSWGRYQWYLTLVYGYHFIIVSINDGFMSFGAYAFNNTQVTAIEPHCDAYRKCTPENFHYVGSFFSIVQDYNLSWIVDTITSFQFAGIMIGAIASGPIVDYFGRKWTFVLMMCAEILCGSLVTLCTSWESHAIMRFLIGLAAGGDMNAGWVYLGEFVSNRHRLLFRASATIISGLSFPLIGVLTRDWRLFELWGNLICVPAVILIATTCYESPRWLIQKGRGHEATKVFNRISKLNGKDYVVDGSRLPIPPKNKSEPFWHLFKGRQHIMFSVCIIVTWFSTSMINFGMFFDVGNLPLDIYETQFLLSTINIIVEYPIALLDTYKPHLISRRLLLLSGLLVAAVINFAVGALFLVPGLINNPSVAPLFSILSIGGQTAISIVFDTAYVYSIELFPTLLRSQAGAMSSASARLGAIIAPQLLSVETMCSSCSAVPYLTFGAVGLIGFVADLFLLPNTKDKALMENVDDDLNVLDRDRKFTIMAPLIDGDGNDEAPLVDYQTIEKPPSKEGQIF